MPRASAILCVSLVSVLWTGTARADAPPRETVVAMLSTIERGPDAAVWRALGPETVGVLVDVYRDRRLARVIRRRAVEACGHYPTPASRTFLMAVAGTPGQHDLTVRTALLALGRAFGASVIAELAGFLGHDDPDIREAAVMALVGINTPAARAALADHRGREDRRWIARRIDTCLAGPARPTDHLGTPPQIPGEGGTGTVAPR